MSPLLMLAAASAAAGSAVSAQTPNAPARGTPPHVGTGEVPNALSPVTPGPPVAGYRATVDRIVAEAQKDGAAWKRMAEPTDTFRAAARRIRRAREGAGLGAGRDAEGRPAERARRAGDGPALGPRRRVRGECHAHTAEVKGTIVLFDVPFTSCGETVAYRGTGPSRAARHGAVATLLRSVASCSMNTPHGAPRTPAQ